MVFQSFSPVVLLAGGPVAASILATAQAPLRAGDELEWRTSLAAAQKEAGEKERPMAVYFWLEGSDFCQRLYGETLTTEAGLAELAHYVCVSIRADQPEAGELLQRFGVSRLPTIVFLDSAGRAEDAIDGFIDLAGFVTESQRIRRGEKTVSDWRRKTEAAPDDLDLRLQLALQLEHVGQREECGRLQESIKQEDPEGRTAAGAQLHLYDAFARVRAASADASDPRTYQLATLYEHMPKVKPAIVCYEGWKWIADVEGQRGDRPKERAAWTNVWTYAPDGEQRLNSGFSVLQRFFLMEVELSPADRLLTTAIADHFAAAKQEYGDLLPLAFVHDARAIALALNGKREEALREAEKAVALDPDNLSHQQVRDALR